MMDEEVVHLYKEESSALLHEWLEYKNFIAFVIFLNRVLLL